MSIDFKKSGADTGYNNDDSIEPVENAEKANQTVFQRPSENLRGRTEDIRRAVDEIDAVVSSDRGLTIMSDPVMTVTWNGVSAGGGDGEFTISDDILLIPIVNPADESSDNNIWGRLNYDEGGSEYFSVRSKLRIGNEGGNTLRFEIFKETGVNPPNPTVTVVGSKDGAGNFEPGAGPVLVRVQIADNNSHQWSDVVTAIDTHTDPTGSASDWLDASVHLNVAATAAKVIAEQFLWEGNGAQVTGIGGCDAQTYAVTPATLAAFFAQPKEMEEGDALVIDFPSRHDRLARAGDSTITMGELQLIHRDESDPPPPFSECGYVNFMGAVPICKVINDRLYFINGAVLTKAQAGTIMPDASLRSELADQTVGTCGAELVGSDTRSGTPQSLGQSTVFGQLGAMITHYNNHVNANQDQHPVADILERPCVVVNETSGKGDHTTIQDAVTALAATGGTIYIKNPATVYNENIVFPNGCGPLLLIGESQQGTIVCPSSGAAVSFGNGDNFPITFYNLNFAQDADAVLIDVTPTSASDWEKRIEFIKCTITQDASATTHPVAQVNSSVVFADCNIKGVITNTQPFLEFDSTLALPIAECRIRNCQFEDWRGIASIGSVSANPVYVFEFCDNTIRACGNNTSGTYTTLITGSEPIKRVKICNNGWLSTSSTLQAYFCNLQGAGIISGNYIDSAMSDDPATPTGTIDVEGFAAGQALVVSDNYIYAGTIITGVRARGNVIVSKNSVQIKKEIGAISNYIGAIEVTGSNCVVSDNIISSNASGADNDKVIGIFLTTTSDPANVIVRNNLINGDWETNYLGIYVEGSGDNVTITNNQLIADADNVENGIRVDGGTQHCVSGNIIQNFGVGINIASAAVAVILSGNVLKAGSFVSSIGLDMDNAYNCVTGNSITGYAMGVDGANATNLAFCGNILYSNTVDYANMPASAGVGPLAAAWPGSGLNYDYLNWNHQ